MTFGTVQNKVPEDQCHSTAKGAAESERESMCGTLPSDSDEPIARGTEFECMTFGTKQNKVPEDLRDNIVKGAAESEEDLYCGALLSDLDEPIARGEGLHNEFACMTVGTVQN